jgi:uncharacterized surface protein with fasciclin (FAS1) repeats
VNGIPTYQKGAANSREDPPQFLANDVETCNGVIHIVNQVMLDKPLPFDDNNNNFNGETDTNSDIDDTEIESGQTSVSLTDAPSMTMIFLPEPSTTPPEEGQLDACASLMDLICATNVTSTLCDMIREDNPDVADDLSDGIWTIFAPIDAAFDDLAVLDDTEEDAFPLDILMFHMVPNFIIMSEDFQCSDPMGMANGKESRTVCETDDTGVTYYQKGAGNPTDAKPEIIQPDLLACNGTFVFWSENEFENAMSQWYFFSHFDPFSILDCHVSLDLPPILLLLRLFIIHTLFFMFVVSKFMCAGVIHLVDHVMLPSAN